VIDRETKPRLKKSQRYILLTACSTPVLFDRLSGQSSGAIRAMKEFFQMAGMTYGGKVVYPGAVYGGEMPSKVLHKIRRLYNE